jgi:HD-like signal output (HDOD) protein
MILNDPALSASIFRISNSPFFNPKLEVETIEYALTFIGMNQLKELVQGGRLKKVSLGNRVINQPGFMN